MITLPTKCFTSPTQCEPIQRVYLPNPFGKRCHFLFGLFTVLLLGSSLFGRDDAGAIESSMDKLRRTEKAILDWVPRLQPAVVCIQAGGGSGSGVIVSADGLVLTAAHVIDKKNELTIVYPDGRKYRGMALGTYGPADAGMVKILEGAPHPFVEVADGLDIATNDVVIAMGHPSGFDIQRGPPLRIGHITKVEENYIESDTALIGGDSGGPAFDLKGRVIGIHSHISGAVHVNRDGHIRQFQLHWESMAKGEHHPIHYSKSVGSDRGDPDQDALVLGVKLMDSEDGRGVSVEDVTIGTPAEKAGLQLGDRLISINSQSIRSAEEFLTQLSQGEFGENVNIDIERDGESRSVAVLLVRAGALEPSEKSEDLKSAGGEKKSDSKLRAPPPKVRPNQSGGNEGRNKNENDNLSPPARSSKLQELAAKAKENGGKIRLTRDELKTLRNQLSKKTETLATATGSRLQDESSKPWEETYRELVTDWKKRIARVIASGKNVGIATQVHSNGWYLCKASDVKNRELELQFADGQVAVAQVVKVDDGLDLALVFCEPKQAEASSAVPSPSSLQTNLFARIEQVAAKGTLCLAVGAGDRPAGYGVVSVPSRPLDGKTGVVLGVQVEPRTEGVRIQIVQPRSPASKAGVRVDDLLHAIDGQPIRSDDDLQKLIQSHLDGDIVRLDLERGDSRLSLPVRLADGTQTAPMPGAREQAMDTITATLSRRRWGFRRGIQHDTAIMAKDVGGPLLSLDGRLLGINIARAGRIQSYAIPSLEIVDFLHTVDTFPKDGLPTSTDAATKTSEPPSATQSASNVPLDRQEVKP